MNVIVSQLFKRVVAKETFGFITKTNREALGLSKSHSNDAVMIASKGKSVDIGDIRILYKKCVAKGDYQQTKGIRSEKRIPTGKILGFRKFDKVKFRNCAYFIKGRRSAGTASLMDIFGNVQKFTIVIIKKIFENSTFKKYHIIIFEDQLEEKNGTRIYI